MKINIEKFQHDFISRCGNSILPSEDVNSGFPFAYADQCNYMVASDGTDINIFLYNVNDFQSDNIYNEKAMLAAKIISNDNWLTRKINFNGTDSNIPFTIQKESIVTFKVNKHLISKEQLELIKSVVDMLNSQKNESDNALGLNVIVYGSFKNKILLLKARNISAGKVAGFKPFDPCLVDKSEIENNFYSYVFTDEQVSLIESRIEYNAKMNIGNVPHDRSAFRIAKLKAASFIDIYGINTKKL